LRTPCRLWQGYEPEYWYFEIVTMVYKFAMSAVAAAFAVDADVLVRGEKRSPL
jgi:hypothetical protein